MCVCAINGLKYMDVNSIWHVLQRVMISGALLDGVDCVVVEDEVVVWTGLIWIEELEVIFGYKLIYTRKRHSSYLKVENSTKTLYSKNNFGIQK